MDRFNCFPAHHLGSALCILDVHPEQHLDDRVKDSAEDPALRRLALVENRAGNPPGPDRAINIPALADQVEERSRGRRAVRIDITDQVGGWSQLQTLDQSPSL